MDGYVHEPDQPQSSPVRSYECQVTVDSTLHRPSCGRLSPSSPVRSSERQVPVDITTHRSLNERLPSSSPVRSRKRQVPVDPVQHRSSYRRPSTPLPVRPPGRQVPVNQTLGSSLKEPPSSSLPVRSLEHQVPISPQLIAHPAWDFPLPCDPIHLRTVRSLTERQVPVAVAIPSPRGVSFPQEAPHLSDQPRYIHSSISSCSEILSDGSTRVSVIEPPYIHKLHDTKSSIRTGRNGLSRTHSVNTNSSSEREL
jgi:hypothetical protein